MLQILYFMNYCVEPAQNFTLSRAHPGIFVCDADHDYVDNECVCPPALYVPDQANKDDMSELKAFESKDGDNGKELTLSNLDGVDTSMTLYKEFGTEDWSVFIPDNFGSYEYYFDLTVDNVVIKPESEEPLSLKSSKANLTLLVLDVIGVNRVCQGQEDDGNDIYQTTCNLVKVEPDSEFTPKYLKFKNIKVGLRSLININTNEDVDIGDAKIELYHSGNKYGNQNAPIKFTGTKGPAKIGDIYIVKIDEGKPMTNEDENFTVAQFNLGSEEESNKTCNDAYEKFQGGDGFKKDKKLAFCVPNEDDPTQYTLVATKSYNDDGGKKKKKLSAGAIAGIVIACVVVVAAIIALLVYFLVIKKKNQSTTSTQGDSSIAIWSK